MNCLVYFEHELFDSSCHSPAFLSGSGHASFHRICSRINCLQIKLLSNTASFIVKQTSKALCTIYTELSAMYLITFTSNVLFSLTFKYPLPVVNTYSISSLMNDVLSEYICLYGVSIVNWNILQIRSDFCIYEYFLFCFGIIISKRFVLEFINIFLRMLRITWYFKRQFPCNMRRKSKFYCDLFMPFSL